MVREFIKNSGEESSDPEYQPTDSQEGGGDKRLWKGQWQRGEHDANPYTTKN